MILTVGPSYPVPPNRKRLRETKRLQLISTVLTSEWVTSQCAWTLGTLRGFIIHARFQFSPLSMGYSKEKKFYQKFNWAHRINWNIHADRLVILWLHVIVLHFHSLMLDQGSGYNQMIHLDIANGILPGENTVPCYLVVIIIITSYENNIYILNTLMVLGLKLYCYLLYWNCELN